MKLNQFISTVAPPRKKTKQEIISFPKVKDSSSSENHDNDLTILGKANL